MPVCAFVRACSVNNRQHRYLLSNRGTFAKASSSLQLEYEYANEAIKFILIPCVIHMNTEKLFDTVKKDNTEIFAEPVSWSSETSYYIQRFNKQAEQKGLTLSWNWPAALFGTTWLFYRKMFLYGFLYE